MLSGIHSIDDELDRAIDHMDDGEYESALPLLARVTSFQPDHELAYELWIQCHVSLGRVEKALELVDAGLQRGLAPAPLHAHRSVALRQAERFDEAVDAAKAALAIDPELSFAIEALASAEVGRGETEAALTIYEDAVTRIPDDEDLHFALLELAAEMGKHELIIENARRFLRRFGRDADVLGILGDAYLALRDYRRADRAFRDAADLEPEDAAHHVMVLVVALLREDQAGFDAYMKQLEADDPEVADEVHREIAIILDRNKREE